MDGALVGLIDHEALVVHAILVDGFGSFTCYVPVVAMEWAIYPHLLGHLIADDKPSEA